MDRANEMLRHILSRKNNMLQTITHINRLVIGIFWF